MAGNKRAFNLDLGTLDLTAWVLVIDKSGLTEAQQVPLSDLITYLNTVNTYELSFTNGDLTANVLTVNHLLNTSLPLFVITDENGIIRNEYAELTIVTANQFTLDFGGAISGTWNLKVKK